MDVPAFAGRREITHRSGARPAILALAVALCFQGSGCPARSETADDIGGASGRTLERARDAAKRTQEQGLDRLERQLGDE